MPSGEHTCTCTYCLSKIILVVNDISTQPHKTTNQSHVMSCILTCALSHTTHSLITDDSPPPSSTATQQGSIIGFAVVLSFLVISIFVVMLICSCYGLCKCPCKRRIAREPHSTGGPSTGSGRRRRERPMIPLPSPGATGATTIKQSTSSSFQHGQKLPTTSLADQPIYSRLQFGRNHHPGAAPSAAAARGVGVAAPTTSGSFREDERRLNQLSPTRFSVPPATNAHNVVHLSQFQSHSYHSDLEQMALGSVNPPSIGRQEGRAYHQPQSQLHRHELSTNNHHHPAAGASSRQVPANAPRNNNTTNGNSSAGPPPPTHNSNRHQLQNSALPPHFQANSVDIPPPYPGMGYPYTPCKSPKTPHSTSASSSTVATIASQPPSLEHSQLHNRRAAMREREDHEQASAGASGAEGQGAGRMEEGESEILTDIDSIAETNSVVSGRGRFKELATSPPSYSTEV